MFEVGFFMSVAIIAGAFLIGIGIIASGEFFLAIREIAFNTRTNNQKKTKYKSLEIASTIISWSGYIIIFIGLIIGILGILEVVRP